MVYQPTVRDVFVCPNASCDQHGIFRLGAKSTGSTTQKKSNSNIQPRMGDARAHLLR